MGFQEVAATNALEACNGISDIKLFRGNGKMFLQNDLGLKLKAAMQSHMRSGKGGEKASCRCFQGNLDQATQLLLAPLP